MIFSLALVVSLAFGWAMPAQASPLTQVAASCPGAKILTFHSWYDNLPCNAKGAPDLQNNINNLWVIVLNLLDDVVQAGAYIAVGFVIWGSIKFMKSQGDPTQLTESRDTIINAMIGLGITLGSIALINFAITSLKVS